MALDTARPRLEELALRGASRIKTFYSLSPPKESRYPPKIPFVSIDFSHSI